jgi:hypothetical protein
MGKSIKKVDIYGNHSWYKNGEFHREDGPAILDVDGYKAYYLNGVRLKEGSVAFKIIQEKERRNGTN